MSLSFASFVMPVRKNLTVGVYFHEPLRDRGAGEVLPTFNRFSGALLTTVPHFFLLRGGPGPVSKAQCAALNKQANDPFTCLEYTAEPFTTSVDVRQQTFGLSGAWKLGSLSVGLTARYQRFREAASTLFMDPVSFDPRGASIQATGRPTADSVIPRYEHDLTFSGGVKWSPMEKISMGAVYKKGPRFSAPTYVLSESTNLLLQKLGDTTFHVPDIYGVGVSVRPIPVLTFNADAVHVTYSNLTDRFVASLSDDPAFGRNFHTKDVTELRAGAEYFFSTTTPFAVRGWWRDPAHSIEWHGPLDTPEAVYASIYFPKGQTQNHWSIGAGFSWPLFQVDAAYDSSSHYNVASVSVIRRF